MQWTQTSVTQPRDVKGNFWPNQLRRQYHPNEHTHNAPDDRRNRELTNHFVIEVILVTTHGAAHGFSLMQIVAISCSKSCSTVQLIIDLRVYC
jgi:hypothetical protein